MGEGTSACGACMGVGCQRQAAVAVLVALQLLVLCGDGDAALHACKRSRCASLSPPRPPGAAGESSDDEGQSTGLQLPPIGKRVQSSGSIADKIGGRAAGRMLMRGGGTEAAGTGGGVAVPKRRGRPPKATPPPLQELPPDFIAQRQAANPRDNPEGGGNVEYP